MKKALLIGMVLLFPACIYGGSEKRIKELKEEGAQLQQKAQEYQQALNQINIRLVQIGAIIGELEGENKKKEVPKDERIRREDTSD